MKKIIIGLVGPIAAGKGATCKYLRKKYRASIYRFSTMLRDVLTRLHLEQNRQNLQSLSFILRKQFGDDLLAAVMAKDVSDDNKKIIAIDGVRRAPDIKYLKTLPGFHLIEINADQKTRWARMLKRSENSDDVKKTFLQFQKDEQAEAERQIKKVSKLAKLKIDNSGSRKNLYRQIDDIIKKITK